MTTASESAARARLLSVQDRTEAAGQAVLTLRGRDGRPGRVLAETHAYLEDAFNDGHINESPDQVRGIVLLAQVRRPDAEDKRASFFQLGVGRGANFKNLHGRPRLTRKDQAWFDFGITLKVTGKVLELYAYRFAIRFSAEAPVSQVRIDLNGPGHANSDFGLRSHIHLNVDDEGFSVPSPIMTHLEVLDVLLFRLRPGVGRVRAAR